MRRRWVWGAIALAGLAVGIGFVTRSPGTMPVTQIAVVDAVYGLGTVTAEQTWELTLGVTSTVSTILVREGDRVAAGGTLAQFDSGPAVRAPFAGVVTRVARKVGEMVFPQSPVLTLVNLASRDVTIPLEQEGALRVRPGMTAQVRIDALDMRLSGTVRTLYPNSGQFMVRIDVPDLPATVLPGMTADVAIEVDRRPQALVIPLRALQKSAAADTTRATITVVRDGQRQTLEVPIGVVTGDQVEIREGILPTDQIVVP